METRKIKTIDLKGKQYAEVKTRLKEFRAENPKGLIETNPTFLPDGKTLFKARILRDKSDADSAEASGHALGTSKGGEKEFEKLETIAVGRALALLGYGADGEIASSDEMEEFLQEKEDKRTTRKHELEELIMDTKNAKQLQKVWGDMPIEFKKELDALKNKKKKEFEKPEEIIPEEKAV